MSTYLLSPFVPFYFINGFSDWTSAKNSSNKTSKRSIIRHFFVFCFCGSGKRHSDVELNSKRRWIRQNLWLFYSTIGIVIVSHSDHCHLFSTYYRRFYVRSLDWQRGIQLFGENLLCECKNFHVENKIWYGMQYAMVRTCIRTSTNIYMCELCAQLNSQSNKYSMLHMILIFPFFFICPLNAHRSIRFYRERERISVFYFIFKNCEPFPFSCLLPFFSLCIEAHKATRTVRTR